MSKSISSQQETALRSGGAPDREAVTATLQRALSERPEVVAGYLFGSVARDRASATSDVDVALLLDEDFDLTADPLYRLRAITDLAARLGCDVDVVILNGAPLVLRNQVLTRGRRIYEADRQQRIRYEVSSWQRYWDFEPILERIYAAMRRHLKEGTYGHQPRGHRDAPRDAVEARERPDSAEDHGI
ncbi:MAG: type VII toxin-antitoxin system MntA family adenylyltransferase antitoxin [Anaerolineae bacterium]